MSVIRITASDRFWLPPLIFSSTVDISYKKFESTRGLVIIRRTSNAIEKRIHEQPLKSTIRSSVPDRPVSSAPQMIHALGRQGS